MRNSMSVAVIATIFPSASATMPLVAASDAALIAPAIVAEFAPVVSSSSTTIA